jgi:hypothetical protein
MNSRAARAASRERRDQPQSNEEYEEEREGV